VEAVEAAPRRLWRISRRAPAEGPCSAARLPSKLRCMRKTGCLSRGGHRAARGLFAVLFTAMGCASPLAPPPVLPLPADRRPSEEAHLAPPASPAADAPPPKDKWGSARPAPSPEPPPVPAASSAPSPAVVDSLAPEPVDESGSADKKAGGSWSCAFPPESDEAEVDEAVVVLIVRVGVDGRALGVRLLTDPGWGFGRQAARCALSNRYEPALDEAGQPVEGSTPPLRIRFVR
jgi:hypothetical protein